MFAIDTCIGFECDERIMPDQERVGERIAAVMSDQRGGSDGALGYGAPACADLCVPS
jgi:hypothetical protein